MKSQAVIFFFLAIVLFGSVPASAENPEDILIVVNGSIKNEQVTKDNLRDIFLKKRGNWSSGIRAVPVYSKNIALHSDFRERLLNMSSSEEARYWQQLKIRTGESKPVSFDNTLKAVFRLRGAVSYIYRSQYQKGATNVVFVLPVAN